MKIEVPGIKQPIRPGKIICVGKNYAAHAEEMKSEVPREPVLFLKPPTALLPNRGVVELPPQSREVHHEIELVVVINREGKWIDEADAMDFVGGYAVGLDMTARDIQRTAKEKGLPWAVSKGFDTFAPLGEIVPREAVPDPHNLPIRLTVNYEDRQLGRTSEMIFSIPYLIAYASGIFTLEPGDLIYTGTPAGVGPVYHNDVLRGRIGNLPELEVYVELPKG